MCIARARQRGFDRRDRRQEVAESFRQAIGLARTMPTPENLMINFIVGNHAPCILDEDVFEYVAEGIRCAGGAISYSIDEYRGDSVNLIVEGSTVLAARSFADFRKKYPLSRLYVIATETFTADGMVLANRLLGMRGEQAPDAADQWERSQAFRELASRGDGLIVLAEPLVDDYRGLNLRTHYLPLVALPGTPGIEREPEAARDIDVFFSGTLTAYRQDVLDQLRNAGLKVMAQSPQYPDYVRRHFLGRAKLAIGLRFGPDSRSLSKHRAHYFLATRMPHLFEQTPDRTDIHQFVQFAPPGEAFVEACVQMRNGVRRFPEQVFDDFRGHPRLDHVAVFRALRQFLQS